jgi:predicted permease
MASAMIEMLNRYMIAHDENLRLALDPPVMLFSMGASLVTCLAFGLIPSVFMSMSESLTMVKADTPNASSSGTVGRLRRGLVVGQIALALVLLSGAGIVVRGMQQFLNQNPGWRMDGLVVAQMSLPEFSSDEFRTNGVAFAELENQLQEIAGVERACLSTMFPVWGFASTDFAAEDRPAPKPGNEQLSYRESVSPGFFETLGIPLLRGRPFSQFDTGDRPDVVIVNRSLAEHFWPGEDPLGKRIGYHNDDGGRWWEIVGVVGDIRFPGNIENPDTRCQLYRPLDQSPQRAITVTLRSQLSPAALIPTLNKVIQETHPGTAPYDITSGRQKADRMLARSSLLGPVLGAFAVMGVLLAAVGIYGVVSFSVAQRTKEIGIRMALGAWRGQVVRMILKQYLRLCVLGVLIGLLGTWAVSRWMRQAIPEASQLELATFVTAVAALIATGIFACWLPARRAARIDPMEALRNE